MPLGSRQPVLQNPLNNFQPVREAPMPLSAQFNSNPQSPLRIPQDKIQSQPFYPEQNFSPIMNNGLPQFQNIERKLSADPYYMPSSPMKSQNPQQQMQRRGDNSQPYMGM